MHRERRVCRLASAYDFRIDDRKSMILLSDRRACTLSVYRWDSMTKIYTNLEPDANSTAENANVGDFISRGLFRVAPIFRSLFLFVRAGAHTRVFPFSTLPDRIVPFVRRRVAQPLFRRSPLDLQFRPRNPRYSTLLFPLSRLHHFPHISLAQKPVSHLSNIRRM